MYQLLQISLAFVHNPLFRGLFLRDPCQSCVLGSSQKPYGARTCQLSGASFTTLDFLILCRASDDRELSRRREKNERLTTSCNQGHYSFVSTVSALPWLEDRP